MSPEATRNLLFQVRAEQGTITPHDLAYLRRPPRLAVIALATAVSAVAVIMVLANIWP